MRANLWWRTGPRAHVVIGLVITALCAATQQPPLQAVAMAGLVGLLRALTPRDLLPFLAVPVGWLVFALLTA